jgi:hypothetical protein
MPAHTPDTVRARRRVAVALWGSAREFLSDLDDLLAGQHDAGIKKIQTLVKQESAWAVLRAFSNNGRFVFVNPGPFTPTRHKYIRLCVHDTSKDLAEGGRLLPAREHANDLRFQYEAEHSEGTLVVPVDADGDPDPDGEVTLWPHAHFGHERDNPEDAANSIAQTLE